MANAYRLRGKLLGRFAWLGRFFEWQQGKLKRIDQGPATLCSLKRQYRFFLRKCPGSFLFFQVGRFFEFYDKQAEVMLTLLGLQRIKARRGFQTRCGFPVNLQQRYLRRLVRLGLPVHVVREEESWLSGVKKRSFAESWIPVSQ
ncbi:MAG: hypothetical protein HY694_05130 [Deltaproteobacteria bacterium]|nr:hypothetical protein [Deltaproteobacteria bacterium]